MNWDTAVDAANLVTMVCAVIGVVLAAVLGWVAIHVARSGNDTARKESLYGQVDDMLNAALGLTAASADHGDDNRELHRAREAFASRMGVLAALGHAARPTDAVTDTQLFADALAGAAEADARLGREGRLVLSETLLSGDEDDHTKNLLKCWADRYLLQDSQDSGEANDLDVPWAFRTNSDVAQQLRESLDRPEWKPQASESLRLIVPWMQEALGLVTLGTNESSETTALLSNRPSPYTDEESPNWSMERLHRWLGQWLPQEVDQDVSRGFKFSPEQMSAQLVTDLRGAFLEQIVRLVSDLRTAVNDAHNADAGWIRRKLGLV